VGLSAADAWVLHDLRRTVTTYLARMGVPPQVAHKNHQQGTIRGLAAVPWWHLTSYDAPCADDSGVADDNT
jgi:hypothetical protein